jgi:hypothetical protein
MSEENKEVKVAPEQEKTLKFYNDLLALIVKQDIPVFSLLGCMQYATGWLVNYGLSQENLPPTEEKKDVQDK